MSKSIYDEVLEIMVNSVLPRESSKTNKLKVIKALEQAQKQEKLLELYRELMTVKDESISLLFIGNYNNDMEKIETKLEKQIKELENNEEEWT